MKDEQSAYIKSIAFRQKAEKEKLTRINEVLSECKNLKKNSLPPVEMANIIGSDTLEHFVNAMLEHFEEISTRCKVTPDKSILDIGCGVGRLAIPFSRLVGDSGSYIGLDVWEEGITWCKSNVGSVNENINFYLLDAKDNYYYNDEIKNEKNNFSLNFVKDDTIDVAFAISVFTHLREDDCTSYFKELNRVLNKNGVAYLTAFIIDDYFYQNVRDTGDHSSLVDDGNGCFYGYKKQDFFAGYTMKKFRSMLDESGLEIISVELGTWANKLSARKFQDTFFIPKKKAPSFLIVGVMKAATTSIFEHLCRLERVKEPLAKELHYFSKDSVKLPSLELDGFSYEEMLRVEPHDNNDVLYGEASPSYILSAEDIYKYNPGTKIIIILRDPVARTLSHLKQNKKYGLITTDYIEKLVSGELDFDQVNEVYDSLYMNWLGSFFEIFKPNKIMLISFEEYIKDQQKCMNKIFDFLEIGYVDLNLTITESDTKDVTLFEEGVLRLKLESYFKGHKGKVYELLKDRGPNLSHNIEAFSDY